MWKEIEGYPNYEISNESEIRNKTTGKILTQYINNRGYKYVQLWNKDDQKLHLCTVHRLVALNFIPNPEEKDTVNHIDGNKLNNSISNLEWLTQSENNLHGWATGLYESQRKAVVANLTSDKCLENRQKYFRENSPKIVDINTGIVYDSYEDVRYEFGISTSAIRDVCTGRRNSIHGHQFRFMPE